MPNSKYTTGQDSMLQFVNSKPQKPKQMKKTGSLSQFVKVKPVSKPNTK
ncbi:MAG: hypothetical protein IKN62_07970 [Elusimicrobia bacterium]|nr:hypothetical protein [Elusimicrobiota bacterium]